LRRPIHSVSTSRSVALNKYISIGIWEINEPFLLSHLVFRSIGVGANHFAEAISLNPFQPFRTRWLHSIAFHSTFFFRFQLAD